MSSPDQLRSNIDLMKKDPEKFIAKMSDRLNSNENDREALFHRHQAWGVLKRYDLALADLDRMLQIKEQPITWLGRGQTLYHLARYEEALTDFKKACSLDPELWRDFGGPLFEADCYVHCNNRAAALTACAQLRDDWWFPGLWGLPRGNKAEATAEISRRADSGS